MSESQERKRAGDGSFKGDGYKESRKVTKEYLSNPMFIHVTAKKGTPGNTSYTSLKVKHGRRKTKKAKV